MYWKNEVLAPLPEGNQFLSKGIPTKEVTFLVFYADTYLFSPMFHVYNDHKECIFTYLLYQPISVNKMPVCLNLKNVLFSKAQQV